MVNFLWSLIYFNFCISVIKIYFFLNLSLQVKLTYFYMLKFVSICMFLYILRVIEYFNIKLKLDLVIYNFRLVLKQFEKKIKLKKNNRAIFWKDTKKFNFIPQVLNCILTWLLCFDWRLYSFYVLFLECWGNREKVVGKKKKESVWLAISWP